MSIKYFNDLNISFTEDTNTFSKVSVEPFERGYAVTIGNSLRRTLLTSLPGAAVTSVKIEGVSHEFSTIEGVSEDVSDIILNLKKIRFRMNDEASSELITLKYESQEGDVLKAGELNSHLSDFTVLNKGLVLANEVIDALPVKRFKKESSSFKEMKVGYSKDNFYWLDVVADPFLTEHLKDLESKLPAPFPSNYYSEINVQLKEWLNIIQSTIDEGVILFIDYGYSVLDYYHPSRFDGNLLCHYRHHVHNDPFFYPGLQDITTSVNFSAVAEYAEDIGLNVSGYTNQVYFLFGCGLDDLVVKMNLQDISSQTKLSQELRKLTMPDEMGERFKVIGLTKKYNKKLICFSKMNQINRL